LSKALDRSQKIAIRVPFEDRADRIAVSKRAIWSNVERRRLKPPCASLKVFLFSSTKVRRLFIIDSINLPTQESNEIGQKELKDVKGLFGFGMGIIRAVFQELGITLVSKLWLKMFRSQAL
jgi:hypothetical protein